MVIVLVAGVIHLVVGVVVAVVVDVDAIAVVYVGMATLVDLLVVTQGSGDGPSWRMDVGLDGAYDWISLASIMESLMMTLLAWR